MKKSAFTLSELLIALSIIGVIAVLTIPKIIDGIFQRSYIVRLEATCKQISDAAKLMMVNERVAKIQNSSLYDEDEDGLYVTSFYTNYLKVIKQSEDNDESMFFANADSYKNVNGEDPDYNISNFLYEDISSPYMLLPNGAAIAVDLSSGDLPKVMIDVNGPSAPNVIGYDLFIMLLDEDGSMQLAFPDDTLEEVIESCKEGTPYSCTDALMQTEWDPNYLN